MTLSLSPSPKLQFLDNAGLPLAGGYLYTAAAGTPSVVKATYIDAAGTLNTNPILLDSAGRCSIWLDGFYYMELWTGDKNVAGSTKVWDQDNVSSSSDFVGLTASVAELNILDGATVSAAELNILDGATVSVAELNLLDGAVAGTAVASKVLALGVNKNVDTLVITDGGLKLGSGAGTAVTSTAAELNYCDGVVRNIQTQLDTMAFPTYKSLVIKSVGDDQSVDMDADYVSVIDSSGNVLVISAFNVTVVLDAANGANALDTGSMAANTGYFLWAISNGTTAAGLASVSATSPTMPSGYTYKALIGWCTTDATTTPFNIEEFTQTDDEYVWATKPKVLNNAGTANTTASVSLAAGGAMTNAVCPPNITKGLSFRGMFDHTGGGVYFHANPVTFSNTLANENNEVYISRYATPNEGWTFYMPVLENQTLYYQPSVSGTVHLWITGFRMKR